VLLMLSQFSLWSAKTPSDFESIDGWGVSGLVPRGVPEAESRLANASPILYISTRSAQDILFQAVARSGLKFVELFGTGGLDCALL